MGFSVLGGEDEGAYAIRSYPFGRKKERPLGFPVLGGADYGAYAIRPYPFDRKKERPLSFLVPEKNGTQKCTP